jgi:trehalose 6-phosphate phosphatase
VAFHKGDATIWIQTDVELRAATRCFLVFVGDDITDEDAFRAIRTRNSGIGVLVGSRPSAATHQLSSTDEVEELIAWVAATS